MITDGAKKILAGVLAEKLEIALKEVKRLDEDEDRNVLGAFYVFAHRPDLWRKAVEGFIRSGAISQSTWDAWWNETFAAADGGRAADAVTKATNTSPPGMSPEERLLRDIFNPTGTTD